MSRQAESAVFVVDDDEAVRAALCSLIRSVGLNARPFAGADAFLAAHEDSMSGCAVVDVRMPGMSGLELQQTLKERGVRIPVVILTGFADVPMAIRAMKAGAVDFIEKPFNEQVLLDAIHRAMRDDEERRALARRTAAIRERIEQLTEREREVMELMLEGRSSRDMADRLHLSVRTIETHRARVCEKMQSNSLAQLVRMVIAAQDRSTTS